MDKIQRQFNFSQAKSIITDLEIDAKKLENMEHLVYEIEDKIKKIKEMMVNIDAFEHDVRLLKDFLVKDFEDDE